MNLNLPEKPQIQQNPSELLLSVPIILGRLAIQNKLKFFVTLNLIIINEGYIKYEPFTFF